MFRFSMLICAMLLMPGLPSAVLAQPPLASDAVEHAANGTINWTSGEVFAKGIGAPPAQTANAAQARAMAERAAFIVALRNLLETVKGVRVDSESVVENFMVKSDVIRTRVDGIVKGAQIVKKQYLSDGSVEVVVGLNMKGPFLNAVTPDRFGGSLIPSDSLVIPRKPSDIRSSQPAPQPIPPARPPASEKKIEPGKPVPPAAVPETRQEPVKPAPALPAEKRPAPPQTRPEPVSPGSSVPPVSAPPIPPAAPEGRSEPLKPLPPEEPAGVHDATVAFKGGVATGLVIDGRGLGLRPALLPRIVDQRGDEVYVGQVVTRTNAVEQGVAGYAKDVNAAANNFRVTDNPAVIKGLKASGTARTDIVIGQADAQSLRQLSARADFLQHCRVIIVY